MKKIIHFIGIDVSKETLDIALIRNNDKSNIYSFKVTNNKPGFKKMKQWLKAENVSLQEAVSCIEHTGMNSKPIAQFILSVGGNLWMEMSLKIIRSMGVQRGKNDKIDAIRIASARPGSCQLETTMKENDHGRPRARTVATHHLHEPAFYIFLSPSRRRMHWNVHNL